jgi:hypothetical protein
MGMEDVCLAMGGVSTTLMGVLVANVDITIASLSLPRPLTLRLRKKYLYISVHDNNTPNTPNTMGHCNYEVPQQQQTSQKYSDKINLVR